MTNTKIQLSYTDATPRGQVAILCGLLQRETGATAQQMLKATGGVTPHNSYSLGIIAARFGFKLEITEGADNDDGLQRYFFTPIRAAKTSAAARKLGKKDDAPARGRRVDQVIGRRVTAAAKKTNRKVVA